jgi:hypothetical protein
VLCHTETFASIQQNFRHYGRARGRANLVATIYREVYSQPFVHTAVFQSLEFERDGRERMNVSEPKEKLRTALERSTKRQGSLFPSEQPKTSRTPVCNQLKDSKVPDAGKRRKPPSLPGAHKTCASCASRAFKKLGRLCFLQRADEKRHNIATCGLLKAAGRLLDWRTAKKKAKTRLQRRRANVKSSKRM